MDDISALLYPESVRRLAVEADAVMSTDLDAAYLPVVWELEAIRGAELAEEHRYHKGHALYNLGVILLGREPRFARTHFIAAYIEDIRTWPSKRPTDAVAGRVLADLFGLKWYWFSTLARLARNQPPLVDPLSLAAEFEQTHRLPDFSPDIPPDGSRQQSELSAVPRGRIVFLGGNYWHCPDRITNARIVIVEAGFEPVVVKEFEYLGAESGPNRERVKSFRLLDACDLAVFEASVLGGWVPEVERLATMRPDVPTLVQFIHSPSVMLPTVAEMPNIEQREYSQTDEMRYNLLLWLHRHQPQPSGPLFSRVGPTAIPSNTPLRQYPPSGTPLPGTANPLAAIDDD
jgi:hypothetical protein